MAAIDQAVADGVDVINYSISGTSTNFADPVEMSFLFAARAGIFVAAVGRQQRPDCRRRSRTRPVDDHRGCRHAQPQRSAARSRWATASTYSGASVAPVSVTAPLINSSAAAMAGADATAAQLCFSTVDKRRTPALDPAKVAGKIVVCDRGVSARVDKSLAVKEAGGVGMILVNTSPQLAQRRLPLPANGAPAEHRTARPVHAYASTAGATATDQRGDVFDYDAPAPFTASFSSRGPLLAGGGDVLKPDVMAPGQDILAAYSPVASGGLDFNQISGTSMSSPHVAGLAALLKDLHPDWSPMAIKSALMTSAYDVLDGPNTDPLVIFSQGAGHVRPNSAADPGLVFNAGWNDWLAFLCGGSTAVSAATCSALVGMGYSTDLSNYNGASIAIGDLAGVQTVTRKVTNVGATAATYTASFTGTCRRQRRRQPGVAHARQGRDEELHVTFTTHDRGAERLRRRPAHLDRRHPQRAHPGGHPPGRPRGAGAGLGNGAPISYNVTFGYAGAFSATARGLVPRPSRPAPWPTTRPTAPAR